MEPIKLLYIAECLENKIRHRKYNNAIATKLFKEKECVFNDARTVEMSKAMIGHLIKSAIKHNGRPRATAISISLAEIALNVLGYGHGEIPKYQVIKVGDFILGVLEDLNLVRLEREDYIEKHLIHKWVKELDNNQQPTYHIEKKTYRSAPWVVECKNLHKVEMEAKERTGISQSKFKPYVNGRRNVNGSEHRLIKSTAKVDKTFDNKPFMKSLSALEAVRWTIDSRIADVSFQLKDELTDTSIILYDGFGKQHVFDCVDYHRESTNIHLVGVDLYRPDSTVVFEPHRGNITKVNDLKDEIKVLKKELKHAKAPLVKAKKENVLEKVSIILDTHSVWWKDKQYCLGITSKCDRNGAILDTVHGTENSPGWLGYGFHLAYSFDYRGRIYPKESFLSPQSNDIAKAHLMFSKAKKIDEAGAKWLYIQTATSFNQSYSINELKNKDFGADYITHLKNQELEDISVDKMTLNDRQLWTDQHLFEMLEVAADPMGSRGYWMSAEKPFMFLQGCFDVAELFYADQDGVDYFSHSVIYIDGVNNGTQHLAAMSLDEVAGGLVGLAQSDIPDDLYVLVMKGILELIAGTPLGDMLAKIPMAKLRKFISKRYTMVKAYDAGVKKGAEIMFQDSYDGGLVAEIGLTEADCLVLAKHLTKVYNKTCTGPVEIKKYLQSLVKFSLNEQQQKNICWTNPAGFPVVTDKYVTYSRHSDGVINGKRICHYYKDIKDIPMTSSHLSAIGANWVHSYDGAHLSLVSSDMADDDCEMSVVHDSFGTHACEVEHLLNTTKSTFIQMYSGDTIKEMAEQITGGNLPTDIEIPELGELDLNDLWAADYFFC